MKILGKLVIAAFAALSVLITTNVLGEMRYRDPDNICVHAYAIRDDVPIYTDKTSESEIKTLLSKDTFMQLCKMDPSGWSRVSISDSNGMQLYFGWVLTSELSRIASHFDENRILLTEAEIHIEFEENLEAFEILKTLANKNYPRAQYELALMYVEEYEGIPVDQKEGIEWAVKAADNGLVRAMSSLMYGYRTDLDEVEGWQIPVFQTGKDLKLFYYWANKAAEIGGSSYQYDLAEYYRNAEYGFDFNIAKALELYKASAEGGDFEAQEKLAETYFWGEFTSVDYEEAANWYKMIAERPWGYQDKRNTAIVRANYMAGLSYDEIGSYQEAINWHKKAIEKGTLWAEERRSTSTKSIWVEPAYYLERYIKDASSAIAGIYHFGLENNNQAFKWYLKAANLGDVISMYNAGNGYALGRGTLKDYDKAIAWWMAAAEDGHSASQYNLGWVYSNIASTKDLSKAKYWIQKTYDNPESSSDLLEDAKNIWETHNLWQEEDIKLDDAKTSTQPSSERTGTGFRVDKSGSILTNNHVVDDCSTIQVGGNIVELVSTDVNNDLALLRGEPSNYIGYFRSGKGIRIGEDITITGYPLRGVLGDGLNAITGTVSSLSGLSNNTTQFQVSAPVNSGNSGGPVLDSSGNIVGVVVSKINQDKAKEVLGEEVSGASFAIKSSIVRDFLDVGNIDYDVARSDNELSNADIVDKAKNFTVLVECWN
ncbi:trypsin-like peptidase domain-containing protein [Candidatus Pseudothioglobus singularis]|nr:trypsin-like peptidase domain-containing protein [Candidatus Pseudothioglobus singularis]